ncbi:conserved hypothetical protein [Culex quinquefasciatus]|uniref:Uncharacterized protein n=1 Tax=Culex quinquefasciatus TaxID=7176 RepID=B0X410_CULQU|nr:conserved hypothetical protein [Culex quinquefasciatus]|eukprot:XP_001864382.1 conserved hypothetical protein [Culex quinquefasciatus]
MSNKHTLSNNTLAWALLSLIKTKSDQLDQSSWETGNCRFLGRHVTSIRVAKNAVLLMRRRWNREAKKFCNVLDVIELDPADDEKTVGEEDDGEAAGVDKLFQALHNSIWSNVDMHRKAEGAGGGGGAEGGKEDETMETLQ